MANTGSPRASDPATLRIWLAGLVSLKELLETLPDNPRIVVSGNHATPWDLVEEIDRLLPRYRLWALNGQTGLPDREGVTLETSFVGPGMRKSPRLSYVPARLSLVPGLFHSHLVPDLVVVHTTKPRDGRVSLGTEVNVLPAAIEACRRHGGKVVAQVNDNMPWTFGDSVLKERVFDLMVEVDKPMLTAPSIPVDAESALIGSLVADRVPDGATLQAGIGAVPDATLRGLTHRTGLRVWTEMFSDSVLALSEAGALDLAVPIVTSFIFGSQELLDWVDGNDRIKMVRTEVTNDPARISRNPSMVSVNTALQVDLFGQANASRIDSRIFSGFGGQTDFIVGALHSLGGQALLALRSWHPKAQVSTIIPLLEGPTTSFQPSAVVTEHGVAPVFGHAQIDQVRHLIEYAAHPRVRDELWEEARELGLA